MSEASVQRFLHKPRDIVKTSPTVRHDLLIHKLNPLIRRWANYHRHVVSKGIFSKVSSADLAVPVALGKEIGGAIMLVST
jgi:RNA-directed DNA polymerase